MPRSGEGIVLFLIILSIIAWIYFKTRHWSAHIPKRKLPFLSDASPLSESLKVILATHGYTGVGGKLRVPLTVRVDGKKMASRLFIDGFAQKDDKLFVIRLERDRMPIEWTGSGVREKFLSYALLYEQAEGVLYINEQDQTIREIKFEYIGDA